MSTQYAKIIENDFFNSKLLFHIHPLSAYLSAIP